MGIVIARQVRSASVVTRRLTTGCMTVCATPEYLATHGTPTRPEELLAHPCLSLPSEYWGDERVFTEQDGEVRVRPLENVIVANKYRDVAAVRAARHGHRYFAELPDRQRHRRRGTLVRLLSDYRLPQVEINVSVSEPEHLPAKVRTFIDHLVEHFSQTPNHQLGEQWLKDGAGKPAISEESTEPLVAHAAYAHAREAEPRPVDGDLGSKLAKPSRTRFRIPAHSPY